MGVTLKQIADELNVSQPLVTYALNGKPGVSEHMRQRIVETADRLGYHKYSNREARLLAGKRHNRRVATGMIALIFPPYGETPWTAVSYYRTLVDGVEYEVGRRGLDLVIAAYRNVHEELPRIVQDRGVDGVVFLALPNDDSQLDNLDLPAVGFQPESRKAVCLVPDDAGGMQSAVDHLVDLGHRRIAYLGPCDGIDSAKNRLGAFRSRLRERGLEIDEAIIIQDVEDTRREDGAAAMAAMLKRQRRSSSSTSGSSRNPVSFTALICHNDLLAMGAIDHLRALGLQVPRDVSVVGFDDVSTDYNFSPALTSVSFSRFEMGKRAVELVCEMAERLIASDAGLNKPAEEAVLKGAAASAPHYVFPTTLSIRQSTCARP